MTMCDGCVAVLDGGKITVTIDTDRHAIKFLQGAGGFFKKPHLPLGERKTCLQVAFLMGLPVKSAFALLLTRVTEPRMSKFMRLEVYKCKER